MKPTSFLLIIGSFAVFILFFANRAFASSIIPSPQGFVNDFAGVLTTDQRSSLEASLENYEKETTNEISIETIKNLNGEDINDLAVRTFEQWKIGKKGKDNGLLVLAAISDRKLKIEVGYGLEPYITDADAGQVIRNTIAPEFQQGKYFEGFSAGIQQIEQKLPNGSNSSSSNIQNNQKIDVLFNTVPFLFVVVVYLFSYFARSKSIWAGGITGGVAGAIIGLILSSLVTGIILAVFFAPLGLLLDYLLSKNYQRLVGQRKRTDWWSTGGGFFGGGFGGGGGGFGGFGGGSSGGGGASGGW